MSVTGSAETPLWCWASIQTLVFRIFSHSSSPSRKRSIQRDDVLTFQGLRSSSVPARPEPKTRGQTGPPQLSHCAGLLLI